MKLIHAIDVCDRMLAHPKLFKPEEEAALRCMLRFVKIVTKVRGSIRELANALEVDLNQQDLFGDRE